MKKIISLCLCALILMTLSSPPAMAVETYTASEECIALIKEYEGFRSQAYEDNGKWYIGYGTNVELTDYPMGVTEMEADFLLRQALVDKEESVNRLLMDYGISVTQYQFDAMVSMTYNLGTQWMRPDYRFCSYLIQGIQNYTEAEIVNAIGTWCHQGTAVKEQLANRRLREAFLFLYGDYSGMMVSRYCYIHFEAAGGTLENSTIFYPVGQPYGVLPTPVMTGCQFLGWYDSFCQQYTGGEMAFGQNITLTARWDGTVPSTQKPAIDYSAWVNPYSDVGENDWFFTSVRELSYKGIMSGYPNGTFQPGRELTCGEALKLILLAAGYTDPGSAEMGAHWAANYLTLAEQLGCVTPGEITDLNAPITRAMVARITAIALKLERRVGASPFADADDGYLLALYEEGILNGSVSGGRRYYNPDHTFDRSEVAPIVSRIKNWDYKAKNDPAQSGYIEYAKKFIPVKRDVPAAPYNKNLFVKDGSIMYYNDPAYQPAIGIDVSSHQGDIDWQKVAATGIQFAFIRVGGRGYSEGAIYEDQKFLQNITGAKAAGLKVGVYFYSQAISTEEAAEEARFVLDKLITNQISLDYPVVYDWEIAPSKTARTANIDSVTLTDCAITFCQTVAAQWFTPMIYCGREVAYTMYDLSRLTDYDLWYPQYASQPSMYYNYRIWQYSDSGSVPGISGKVDMDIAFLPY